MMCKSSLYCGEFHFFFKLRLICLEDSIYKYLNHDVFCSCFFTTTILDRIFQHPIIQFPVWEVLNCSLHFFQHFLWKYYTTTSPSGRNKNFNNQGLVLLQYTIPDKENNHTKPLIWVSWLVGTPLKANIWHLVIIWCLF